MERRGESPKGPENNTHISLSAVRKIIGQSSVLEAQKSRLLEQLSSAGNTEMQEILHAKDLQAEKTLRAKALETQGLKDNHSEFVENLLGSIIDHLNLSPADMARTEDALSKVELVEKTLREDGVFDENNDFSGSENLVEERIVNIIGNIARDRKEDRKSRKEFVGRLEDKLKIDPKADDDIDMREDRILDSDAREAFSFSVVSAAIRGLFDMPFSDLSIDEQLRVTYALRDLGIDFDRHKVDQKPA